MLSPEDLGLKDEDFQNLPDDEADTQRDTEEDEGLEGEDGADQAADTEFLDEGDELDSDSQAEGTDASGAGSSQIQEAVMGSSAQTKKEVADSTVGDIAQVPQNVKSVAAIGAAAQMVELLGGEGVLIGTNADFAESPLARYEFEDLSSVEVWWNGSGTTPCADMDALLAAHPDVCLEISGDYTFSQEQVALLEENGIAYVVLYPLDSVEHLEQDVSLTAKMLESVNPDSLQIAEEYVKWVEQTVQAASHSNELYSLYLCGWDAGASYQLYNVSDSYGHFSPTGSGVAMTYTSSKGQLISSFMAAAGVTNEADNVARDKSVKAALQAYVCPMFHQLNAKINASSAAAYSYKNRNYTLGMDMFTCHIVSGTNNGIFLGEPEFPAIITDSRATADAVRASWFWQYHQDLLQSNGLIDGAYYFSINGEYDIYVNPQGMVDWACSLESPLEALWVSAKFYGSSLDYRGETNAFYTRFFGKALTEEQLNGIFAD